VNLAAILDGHPDDAPALVEGDTVIGYGELRRRVAAVRAGLVSRGVGPGDRVGLVLANSAAFVSTYLGVLGVGAVAVPLNPNSPPREIESETTWVGAGLIVTDENVFGLAGEADQAPSVVERNPDDLAVLIFTAGTAGLPKAAMLTHGNLLANIDQVQRHPGRAIGPDDVALGVLPMFHIFGLNVVLGMTLRAGGAIVLVERFDPAVTLEASKRHKVTLMAGAPTMYAAWVAMPDADPAAFVSVRLAFSGAAPLPDEVATGFEARFGVVLRQGYGLTEASPVVTTSMLDRPPPTGSIGVPIPDVQVRLIDEEGEDALAGDPGEVWVKGPNVFPGYWQDPDATAVALTPDGWLRTGDVAVAGDDGELYLVDRVKDLIIVSGFNVFPAEVEGVLREHPAVADVAVVGEPDPRTGERVQAYVVALRGSDLTEEELSQMCGGRMARYKCPSEITLVPELPHGLGGKLLRRALRQEAPPEA
jgi:long-chain acyl-CoA synthetase